MASLVNDAETGTRIYGAMQHAVRLYMDGVSAMDLMQAIVFFSLSSQAFSGGPEEERL